MDYNILENIRWRDLVKAAISAVTIVMSNHCISFLLSAVSLVSYPTSNSIMQLHLVPQQTNFNVTMNVGCDANVTTLIQLLEGMKRIQP